MSSEKKVSSSGTPHIDELLREMAGLDDEWNALIARMQLTTQREKEIAAAGFKAGQRYAENKRCGN